MSTSEVSRDIALGSILEYIGMAFKILQVNDHRKTGPDSLYAYEALNDYAVEAVHASTPKWVPRGVRQHCFFNAYTLAMQNPELTYMEGFAYYMIPIHHAWVVDPDGRVIDNTWDEPGAAYYGIPFKTEGVEECARKSPIYSILFNHHLRYVRKRHIHLATLDKLRAINCTSI